MADQDLAAALSGEALQVFNTAIPAHSLNIDANKLKLLLANSISLNYEEKMQIIQNVPFLIQAQIDNIMKLLENEATQYQSLLADHKTKMKEIETARLEAEQKLDAEIKAGTTTVEEQAKLEQLRKEIASS